MQLTDLIYQLQFKHQFLYFSGMSYVLYEMVCMVEIKKFSNSQKKKKSGYIEKLKS